MKCPNCHNDIPNNAKFCKYCGFQQMELGSNSGSNPPKVSESIPSSISNVSQNVSSFFQPYTAYISKFSGFNASPYESEMISEQAPPIFNHSKSLKLSTSTILKIQLVYWVLASFGLFQKQINIRWFRLTQLFQNEFSSIVFFCGLLILALIVMDILLLSGTSKNKAVLMLYGILSLMISSFFTLLLIYYLPLAEIGNHFGAAITFWGFIISFGGLFNFTFSLSLLARSAAQQNN